MYVCVWENATAKIESIVSTQAGRLLFVPAVLVGIDIRNGNGPPRFPVSFATI